MLIAASKIVGAQKLFEIGTFLGSTTLSLALNVPDDAQIFTLDLGTEHAEGASQHPSDAPLTRMHLGAQGAFDFSESPVRTKITTLTGDSKRFDFSPWSSSIDLVFVDGGHDLATVRSDTESALLMARKDKASCVLWHDYRNPDHSALTSYLDELSERLNIFHIEDTMLCAWFNDTDQTILPYLLAKG